MYKKMKPKYGLGTFLGDNAGSVGAIGNLAGELIPQKTGTGRVVGGVLKGVASGAAAGPLGMAIGGGLGLISSLLGNSQLKKQQEAEQRQLDFNNQRQIENTSRINLAGFNTHGYTQDYYAEGGTIDLAPNEYEVEKDEVVQGNPNLEESTELASDMQLVGGNKHEQGGTNGSGGERIYSDRLKVGKEATEALKSLGIKLPNNATFADAAKYLGKNKGKAEKKIASRIAPSVKTGKRMLQEQDDALDTIFQLQEMTKPRTDVVNKFAFGGDPSQRGRTSYRQVPELADVTNNFSVAPTVKTATIKPMVNPTIAGMGVEKSGGIMDWLGKNEGQLINGASYLANLNTINKIDTNVKRDYVSAPRYNYTDRSGVAKRENMAAFRNTTKALTTSSQGVNASNVGALYAKTLDNNSQINNQENARRDQYDENYGQRADKVNYINTSINNEAYDERRDLENNKRVTQPLQARNAFLQGYAGNTAMTQKSNLDKQRMMLSAFLNDENGVLGRITTDKVKKMQDLPIFKMFNNR